MNKVLTGLKKLAELEGIKISHLEKKIGASKGVISRAINAHTDIQAKWISKIIENYPQYNVEWLLTGKGEVYKKINKVINPIKSLNKKTIDRQLDQQEVPFYNIEAIAGLKELFKNESYHIIDTIKIPNLPKCDGAIKVVGDSMYPLLKSGDIVLYKEVRSEDIFFGEMYLISIMLNEWDEYITVKYIQKSTEGSNYIKLVSHNENHQSKDILIKSIKAIALIKASVRLNTLL